MDVVSTKDQRLVLRHDLTLDDSTNVKQYVRQNKLKTKRRTACVPASDVHAYEISFVLSSYCP